MVNEVNTRAGMRSHDFKTPGPFAVLCWPLKKNWWACTQRCERAHPHRASNSSAFLPPVFLQLKGGEKPGARWPVCTSGCSRVEWAVTRAAGKKMGWKVSSGCSCLSQGAEGGARSHHLRGRAEICWSTHSGAVGARLGGRPWPCHWNHDSMYIQLRNGGKLWIRKTLLLTWLPWAL